MGGRRKKRHQRLGPARQHIGERLREARRAAGLSQEAVARELGLPRSAVSEMESGKLDVLAVELAHLARLYGRPIEVLLGVGAERPVGGDVMLRAQAGEPVRREIAQFLECCHLYQELEEWTGQRGRSALEPLAREVRTYRAAQELADRERERLELGLVPGRVLLDALEQRLRIKVVALPLPEELSGCSVWDPEFGPAILINRKHSGGRQVFTLAHEYFHLLTARQFAAQRQRPVESSGVAMQVCAGHLGEPVARKPKIEQLADQFAGRLLLPREHFVERLQGLRKADGTIERFDLIQVARYFGVSVQAVFVGLARAGLVPWELAHRAYHDPELQEAIARSGGEVVPEPVRFMRLAAEAIEAGKLTRARLAEVLHLGMRQVASELARYGVEDGARRAKLVLPG